MTISLCMIVRDVEEHLHQCLSSVEKYVDEIIIVDTGSVDRSVEIAKEHGAQVYFYTAETNPEGFLKDDENTGAPPPYTGKMILANFSAARNLSFEKATKDYVLWIDSDDVVEGADQLPIVARDMAAHGIISGWFRYDYSFLNGQPNCQLWRERLIRRGAGRWINPIHEICDLDPSKSHQNFTSVVIKHRRGELKTHSPINLRNYKVLRKYYEETKDNIDPRTLFYLGNEAKIHAPKEAIEYYEQYLRKSGWDEERSVARVVLGQIHEMHGDLESAFKAYSSAHWDFPSNPDSLFALARIAYKKSDFRKCVELTEKALALGSPQSPVMYNPLDRNYHPHAYYNVALNHIGRVADAARSCEAGLAVVPEDTNLQHNLKLYREFLAKNPGAPNPAKVVQKSLTIGENPLLGDPELPAEVSAAFAVHIWKEMLRFDEVAKAKEFLDSLPYFMDEFPFVKEARAKTEALLKPVHGNADTRKYYAEIHNTEEAFPPDVEIAPHLQVYGRWSFVERALEGKRGLRILDIGCQDGWISNRLAKKGHSVVGIDFSAPHLAHARRWATQLNVDASFIEGFFTDIPRLIHEKFDVVICTEVLEHVVNIDEMMTTLSGVLADDGMLLVSTPRGAWLRGATNLPLGPDKVYTHKWNEPREHVRAFSIESLRSQLSKSFNVLTCMERPVQVQDVPGQGNIFAVCTKTPVLPPADKLNVVIWTGSAWEPWSPISPYEEGTGGSELACGELGKELRKLGHKVTVYSDCPEREGLYDGVDYIHFSKVKAIDCDVFVCSRQAHVVLSLPVRAKAKFLWVHDIHVGGDGAATHSALLEYDRILCLSNWHKAFFCQTYPWLDTSRVLVTRNGIHLERFPNPERSRGNRLIYTSSANRGLDKLLDLFPRIRNVVPDVELDVFYGFNVWRRAAANNPAELAEIDRIEAKLRATEGVVAHGRANQQTLAKAWLRAKVWAYPTWFTETSCISAMEAQAAGCVPVTSNIAALNETVQTGAVLPYSSPDYDELFIGSVISLLTNEPFRQVYVDQGRKHAETLSWRALACQWTGMFHEVMKDAQVNPMAEYKSCG